MKKFIITMGIVALAALMSTTLVEAKGPGSNKPIQSVQGPKKQIVNGANTASLAATKNKSLLGQSFMGKDGKTYKYAQCPSALQQCCKHFGCCHWNHFCWYGSFGCCGYYCPIQCGWYYWYEPFYCYLPVQYIETYRPIQVAPASPVINVNTNTNTNVNQNGAAPAGPPALPPGATQVPEGFTPMLPGKE